MLIKKIIQIVIGLLLIFIIAGGIAAINHPIILKWLSGTARVIGKPIKADVYTNGELNPGIKVFHVNEYWNRTKADYYLLHFSYMIESQRSEYIIVNRKDSYVGLPSSTNKKEYDKVFGFLFQGEVGSKFTPFENDIKGSGFDTQLSFAGKTIKFKVPEIAREFQCDSIRIEL
jgi:hypothetical protein